MSIGELLANVPWWVWLVQALLYPVYQTVGTLKHEGAHALAAMVDGRGIDRFVFWPQRDLGFFTWGYVLYRFDILPLPRYVHLMPYYVDAALFIVGLALLTEVDWYAVPVFWCVTTCIIFIALPVVDLFYNLGKWAIYGTGDFAQAYQPEQEQ